MERGGLSGGWAALLALAVLVALPTGLADTSQAPVRGKAWAGYEADAGALLGQARGYDPEFRMDFSFQRASLYEILIPVPADAGTRGAALPALPAVLTVRHVGAGTLVVDPAGQATVLLLTDPQGFGVQSLPVQAPREPARFLVEALAPVGGDWDDLQLQLDPHRLEVASGLRYTIEGLAVEEPLRAHAEGGLLALIAGTPVAVAEGRNLYTHDLGPSPGGERVLLVRAEGARVDLAAMGLTAVLRFPEASLEAGGDVVADALGRRVGTGHQAGVASDGQGLALLSDARVAGALLGTSSSDALPGGNVQGQAVAFAPSDAAIAAAGAALGTALALAALGLASLWASGKYGLFALLAPLYARLQTDEVLLNHTREAIYRHVAEHPGVNVSEVVKRFGLGWGATVYHLRVLERNHLIVASKQGRQVCYFQNGGRYTGQMAGIGALRNANAALVARTILEHPGAQQREVCRLTGLAQPTVSWHLQKLEEARLVGGDGAPRKRYHALPALEELARRGLLPSGNQQGVHEVGSGNGGRLGEDAPTGILPA